MQATDYYMHESFHVDAAFLTPSAVLRAAAALNSATAAATGRFALLLHRRLLAAPSGSAWVVESRMRAGAPLPISAAVANVSPESSSIPAMRIGVVIAPELSTSHAHGTQRACASSEAQRNRRENWQKCDG